MQSQIGQIGPGLAAIQGLRHRHLTLGALVTHQRQPVRFTAHQQRGLQQMPAPGNAHQTQELTSGIEAQRHRDLDAQFKIGGQNHAAVGQRQRGGAHQRTDVPPPRQWQDTLHLKAQGGKVLRRLGLSQVHNARRRPTTPARANHEQVNPTLGVAPGHRVTQTPHPKAELLGDGFALDHKARRTPLLGSALELRGGNLHIRRTLARTSKPEREQGRRVRRRQRQQTAGVRGRRVGRHRDLPLLLHHPRCLRRGFQRCWPKCPCGLRRGRARCAVEPEQDRAQHTQAGEPKSQRAGRQLA